MNDECGRTRLFEDDSEVISGLWMGSPPRSWERAWEKFDVIVSLISMGPTGHCPNGKIWIVHPLEDSEMPADDESLFLLADLVTDLINEGKTVLVHCGAGLNRSGLICALVVRELRCCRGTEAIDIVRAARGPIALSNPYFTRFLNTLQAPP